jgi:hypothetical protein
MKPVPYTMALGSEKCPKESQNKTKSK